GLEDDDRKRELAVSRAAAVRADHAERGLIPPVVVEVAEARLPPRGDPNRVPPQQVYIWVDKCFGTPAFLHRANRSAGSANAAREHDLLPVDSVDVGRGNGLCVLRLQAE